jgi:hypothetical protein
VHITIRSAIHVGVVGVVIIIIGGALLPPVSQQYCVPPPTEVPWLQASDELTCVGVSLPVHEKPIEAPVQPTTLESAAHPGTDDVSTQQ